MYVPSKIFDFCIKSSKYAETGNKEISFEHFIKFKYFFAVCLANVANISCHASEANEIKCVCRW